jgi:hypothetical protein
MKPAPRKGCRFLHKTLPMKFSKLFTLIALAIFSIPAFAQMGTLRGRVFDESTGQYVKDVQIYPTDSSASTVSDLDGQFELQLKPGNYSIFFQKEGFLTVKLTDVKSIENAIESLGEVGISPEKEVMGEISITVKANKNTEESLLTAKRLSGTMMDGISSANFKKIGDGDAAGAMSRVTGVSIEGGKYVFVRGLGDRYTKTTLNGMDIPGLDPDRNTIQMDLFPTNVIDNIIVAKTFTADLSADFTGGSVDISTKDFPDKKISSFSGGFGYNPNMHLRSNYLSYKGGKTDWLGFDDGTRGIPTDGRTDIPQYAQVIANPDGTKGQEYQTILRGFNPIMGATQSTSFMDFNLGYNYSNQKKLSGGRKLGYSVAATYKNETDFYQGIEYNLYGKNPNTSINELSTFTKQRGDEASNKVLLGALATVALKTADKKIKVTLLHIQNGESKSGNYTFLSTDNGTDFNATQFNLDYTQRTLTNLLVHGSQTFANSPWKLEWKITPTRSAIEDPDIRFSRFREGDYIISTEVGLPERIWRNLLEYNLAGKVDVERETTRKGLKGNVKLGLASTVKYRDYNIQNFQFSIDGVDFTGDPNQIFVDQNYFSSQNIQGLRYTPMFIPRNPNAFKARSNYLAAYASNELPLNKRSKLILGLRSELYQQFYTGINQENPPRQLQDERVLNNFDIFPSANFIHALSKRQNLRLSATRTIARPSLKEMSFATILDPITGRTFIGGMFPETTQSGGSKVELWDGNLKPTHITNLDVRWENFMDKGQMLSMGLFYKALQNPIEIVQFLSDQGSFQPRNVGNAQILGLELEVRKNLKQWSKALEGVTFNTNITLTQSSIALTPSEKLSRELSARDGQIIGDRRAMAGQAPYIVNAGLAYAAKDKKFDAGLYLNVQGPTLLFVGYGNRSDVYSVPFNSLNFNSNFSFGPQDRMAIGFKVTNVLNDNKEQIFTGYLAQDQYFSRFNPGRTFSLKYSYTF